MLANRASARLEASQRMLQVAMTYGSGTNHEGAVGHRVRH